MFGIKTFSGTEGFSYSYRVFSQELRQEKPPMSHTLSLPTDKCRQLTPLQMNFIEVLTDAKISQHSCQAEHLESCQNVKNIIENFRPSKKEDAALTHFISIPLTDLSRNVSKFQETALELQTSADAALPFISPFKFHLTVCMLSLAQQDDIEQVVSLLNPILTDFQAFSLDLNSIDILKGSPEQCSLLHAKVSHNHALDRIGSKILLALACAGLLPELRPIKWHASLINSRYAKPTPFTSFDATGILRELVGFSFGTANVSSIHLSNRSGQPDPNTGYYASDHQWQAK